MSKKKETWHPGEFVPASGIYVCDCGGGHHWSTDVKGHRFPPLPSDCTGESWALKTQAHPEFLP
ncbi:hypothetical protein G3I60_39630 [Streptomyces sp. SID13666]|uniref:hypothetical protein n=1 Tax=unclassified Streptomyces TaxID=2593676 RepID=UPI0013C255D3|nr:MULTISPECIES: hypothetical protein [unclassified Streptomyces]MCZ4098922.1 hypothetical protein [Streptomyces sp. H39-C1]NEA60113.1 hypothetical protein [Streptomyces sp. SID13666]